MIVEKVILTATEAAAMLGVSTQTVYGMLETGQLRGYRENEYTSWKIDEDALKECAHSREAEALERMRKNQAKKEKQEDIFRKKDGNSSKKDGDSFKKPKTS